MPALIGHKHYDRRRFAYIMDVLLHLTTTMPLGIKNSFDEEYLMSRTGIYPGVEPELEMFQDVLSILIEHGFYVKLPNGDLYILDK